MKKSIPLSVPFLSSCEQDHIQKCLDDNFVSSIGPMVASFEKVMAEHLGVAQTLALNSGTSALHLALSILGVKPGDEVIVPNLTFIAPLNAISYCHAHAVLIDACTQSLGMDPASLENFLLQNTLLKNGQCYNKKTKRRIKSIIVVHVLGFPAQIKKLIALARQFHLTVIEDACESLGTSIDGIPTGTWADVGCFSFNGNKIITTGGGGLLTSRNPDHMQRARHLATTAKMPGTEIQHDHHAFNYRMVSLLAAVGLGQMQMFTQFLNKRRKNNQIYREQFAKAQHFKILESPCPDQTNFWLSAIVLNLPHYELLFNLSQFLTEQGIENRPLWKPMHLLSMNQDCQRTSMKQSQQFYESVLCLPSSYTLTLDEQKYIGDMLNLFFQQSFKVPSSLPREETFHGDL